MKTIFIFFAILILINQVCAENIIKGSPSYLFDGDSFILNNQQIRLKDIDCPENKQLCKDQKNNLYKCGLSSKEQLKKIINDKNITCIIKYKDVYNRNIAECLNFENKNINSLMVKTGFAIASEYKNHKTFTNEEETAKQNKLGIWKGNFKIPYKWRKKYGKTKEYKY